MDIGKVTTICILVSISLAALVSLWLIGAVVHVTLWYPERIIPDKILAMAQSAQTMIGGLLTGLVMVVLVKQQSNK